MFFAMTSKINYVIAAPPASAEVGRGLGRSSGGRVPREFITSMTPPPPSPTRAEMVALLGVLTNPLGIPLPLCCFSTPEHAAFVGYQTVAWVGHCPVSQAVRELARCPTLT
jgi:hypothetical protein